MVDAVDAVVTGDGGVGGTLFDFVVVVGVDGDRDAAAEGHVAHVPDETRVDRCTFAPAVFVNITITETITDNMRVAIRADHNSTDDFDVFINININRLASFRAQGNLSKNNNE